MCRLLTERLGIGSILAWSEFQYHVTPPLFGLPFSPHSATTLLSLRPFRFCICASSLPPVFPACFLLSFLPTGPISVFFFVPLNQPLHYYHTYELQRFKIRTLLPLPYTPTLVAVGGGEPVVDPPNVPYLFQRRWTPLNVILIGESFPSQCFHSFGIHKACSPNQRFKPQV